MLSYRHIFGSLLLVSGTCIGGGMLALPVLTSLGGFLPSLVIYFLTWVFMASTGLLLLEVCLWMDKESNLISMATETLGSFGKVSSWIVYLGFFYTLTIAYVAGSQNLVSEVFSGALSPMMSALVFILIFSPFIYLGARAVEAINIWLMIGLALTFLIFVILGFSYVNESNLTSYDIKKSLLAFPVIFTAFGFQGIIPSITFYLKRKARVIRLVILLGSFIPLLVYVLWQWLILGIVPREGPGGLIEAISKGETAIMPLKGLLENKSISIVGQYFAFFALATSLLGVTLGLRDFLADGLKIKKDHKGRFFLCLLIFIPPWILSSLDPHLFLKALDLAGGFGCAYLLGVLPIMMVWSGRYHKGKKASYQFFGGRITLILLALFVMFEIVFETLYVSGITFR